jgi:hypothetical protein
METLGTKARAVARDPNDALELALALGAGDPIDRKLRAARHSERVGRATRAAPGARDCAKLKLEDTQQGAAERCFRAGGRAARKRAGDAAGGRGGEGF